MNVVPPELRKKIEALLDDDEYAGWRIFIVHEDTTVRELWEAWMK